IVRYSGVLGVEETHQSIPNLVVKLYCGDDYRGGGQVVRQRVLVPQGWEQDGYANGARPPSLISRKVKRLINRKDKMGQKTNLQNKQSNATKIE
ncbi:hypothetical protein PHJA_002870400, partial [Phtheirospermum japonicum]